MSERNGLPMALEMERAVIGGLTRPLGVERAVEVVESADFTDMRHRHIFEAAVGLMNHGREVDFQSLCDALRVVDHVPTMGLESYLAGCITETVSAANIDHHAAVVREKALLRRLIEAAERAALQGRQAGMTPEDMLETLDAQMSVVTSQMCREDAEALKTGVARVGAEVARRTRDQKAVTGIPTGFTILDRLTAGLQPGLIIVAGKTSHGKTAFAVGLIRHAGVMLHIPTVLFTLEMSRDQIIERLLSSTAKVNNVLMRSGHTTAEDRQRLSMAEQLLAEAPVYIDGSSDLSLTDLRVKLRRHVRLHGVRLALVDHLQLVKRPNLESDHARIAAVSRGLKLIAKDLNLPLVVGSQFSRASGDEMPSVSELRGSGEIEENAPTIVILWRRRDKQTGKLGSEARIVLAKQTGGPPGSIDAHFHGPWTTFEEAAHQSEE